MQLKNKKLGVERTDSVSANNSFEKRSQYVILELSTA